MASRDMDRNNGGMLSAYSTNFTKIRCGATIYNVCGQSVRYIKAEGNYSTIFLNDGKKIFTSKTLKHWMTVFVNPNFKRIHSSTLINFHNVYKISKQNGVNTYHFTDGTVCECKERSKFKLINK
jgi:two-component system LytT family response regulator